MEKRIKTIIVLNVLLLLYSFTGVCSKIAAGQKFLSIKFCVFYGLVLLILFIYALGWQQIIKVLPLTTAFANKAITVVWGLIWGIIIFHESVNFFKILGVLLVIAGVILFALSDKEENDE